MAPESPAWCAWLDQVSSFAFSGKSGHFTVRKEAKQCGDWYWSAYLATGERLTKKHLDKTADLTLARLEHIAGMLSAQSETQLPPPLSPIAGADAGVETVPPAPLAQQGHPLHPLLATKLHVPRPRTHLVPRAHARRATPWGRTPPALAQEAAGSTATSLRSTTRTLRPCRATW